jgi:hypothetical protein
MIWRELMTTEKIWSELIKTGIELHKKASEKKLPGEMNLTDFMNETGYGKDKARAILQNLVQAGLLKTRVDGRVTYYSPK